MTLQVQSTCRYCTAEIRSGSVLSTFSWVCDHPRPPIAQRIADHRVNILRRLACAWSMFAAEGRPA